MLIKLSIRIFDGQQVIRVKSNENCPFFVCNYDDFRCIFVEQIRGNSEMHSAVNMYSQEILDSIAEGLFTVDKDFRIIFFNKSAERITGLHKSEVVGKFCKSVFNSDYCTTQCPIAAVLISGKNVFDLSSTLRCINGAKVNIRLNAAVLKNDSNEPLGGVISFHEVSSLDNIENYLVKYTHFYGIVGLSKAMTNIFNLIVEIADCDASVLITGETGTGKELIANAIQSVSKRKDKPFIKVNCSVLPENLIASELFGHVKGSFTGAIKDRKGRFELADKGTLFLDEVAEMPTRMQLQLLRVLEEGTFEKIGESITKKVDVRIIAATNIEIEKATQEGKFREDLFYRLNVIPIRVPPLRERKEDIVFIVKHLLKKLSLTYKKDIIEISDEALEWLLNYNFPGNVRELENAIEFAFIRTLSGAPIILSKLPPTLKSANAVFSPNENEFDTLESVNLLQVLQNNRWNLTRTAELLGIHRTTLWRKLKKMGVQI